MDIKKKFGIFFVSKCFGIGMLFIIFSISISESGSTEICLPEKTGIFTAYTATVYQTDSTPTITASNQKVRKGIVANNCLPFGTKIKLNDKIYEIQDRMNRRYGCDNFDIYMCDYSEAVNFGVQELRYELI